MKRARKTRIALLLRHRWIAESAGGFWVCLRLAVCLHPSLSDPTCPGCRSTIDFTELEKPERYADPESLQLGLDLLFARLVVKAAQTQVEEMRAER